MDRSSDLQSVNRPSNQSIDRSSAWFVLFFNSDEVLKSFFSLAVLVGVSAKTVVRILQTSGISASPSKRGRRAVLNMKEEEALVTFLLELDKVNLNWTWPLFHKLLEIIAQKRSILRTFPEWRSFH